MLYFLEENLNQMKENPVNHDIVLAILYWFKSKDHIQFLVEMIAKKEDTKLIKILE